jgi:hypothetical protein
MLFLKQSTAGTVKIGPFLDSTDGNTAETGLTISQADVRLSKNGGNIAQKNEASACTHDELGLYDCDLDTTDTGTLGRLQLWVHESGALQVWHEFMVVPANVYDSLVGGTDTLEGDIKAISGDETAADNAEAFFDGTGYAGTNNVIPTVTTLTGHTAQTGDNYARLGAPAGASVSADIAAIEAQTDDIGAAGAGLTAIPWNAAWDAEVESEVDDALGAAGADLTAIPWNAAWDAEVQSEVQDAIEANPLDHLLAATYDPASKPGTADALLNEIIENDGGVSRFTENSLEQAPSGTGASAATIADAVWDEAIAGHVAGGSFGEEVQAHALSTEVDAVPTAAENRAEMDSNSTQLTAIVADTNELQTDDVPGLIGALQDPTVEAIADQVWDEPLAGHTTANTAGKFLIDTAKTDELPNSPPTAAQNADAVWDEALAGHTDAGSAAKALADIETDVTAILVDTGALNDTALPDSVPADGSLPTLKQAMYMLTQFLTERAVSGTTVTVKKVDGSTSLMTFTLDHATTPTSITRAT